jgi:GR25 family glycosyltransferase involved in LPS biosynthesis
MKHVDDIDKLLVPDFSYMSKDLVPAAKRFRNMQELLPPELVCICSHSKVCSMHTDLSGSPN